MMHVRLVWRDDTAGLFGFDLRQIEFGDRRALTIEYIHRDKMANQDSEEEDYMSDAFLTSSSR